MQGWGGAAVCGSKRGKLVLSLILLRAAFLVYSQWYRSAGPEFHCLAKPFFSAAQCAKSLSLVQTSEKRAGTTTRTCDLENSLPCR